MSAPPKAGATIINDITGCTDPKMIELVKTSGCKIVIMHMRGMPETVSTLTDYPEGVLSATRTFLSNQAKMLVDVGVSKENIILDPGIGFAKTADQSFELIRHIQEFTNRGYPVVRVHDVASAVQTRTITETILGVREVNL